MKKYTKMLWLLILMCSQEVGFAQQAIRSLLDSVIQNAHETSMYRAEVNWDVLQQQVYAKAENAQSVKELIPAFEALLNGMRDHHGKIIDAKTYQLMAGFTDFANQRFKDGREFPTAEWKAVNDTALRFSYQMLADKVGYLKIVGIASNVNIEAEAKKIRAAVIALEKSGAKAWIIDLRYNGGGNMHPMMAGIGPLLGEGKAGGLVDLQKNPLFDWEIKKGNFVYGGFQAVDLPYTPTFKKLPKVAILTSKWTLSSGEIVATAFQNRPNTRFFGEATGGYTTNLGWGVIAETVIVSISTAMFCDRKGVVFEHQVPVDVTIPFEIEKDLTKDKTIAEAHKWLIGR